jgi:uncharacterized protein (TIGR03083 family)
MTGPSTTDRPLDELRYALAEADADEPPMALRARVLHAAEAERAPGVAVGTGPTIGAVEAYRRTVASFDAVLSALTEDEWHRPTIRGLDVQRLVGHLIGVERQLHAALDGGPVTETTADHVLSTEPDAQAQVGRPPSETHAEWLELSETTIRVAESLDPAGLRRVVALHTFTIPIERMLVVRSFETWTHEEDIRRATGRPLAAPDSSRLRLMTELAVGALPAGLRFIDQPQPGRTARIVLTGPGGGTWQASLDRGTPGAAEVRLVADATSFCRLVANRMPRSDFDVVLTGDDELGEVILAGARALALD